MTRSFALALLVCLAGCGGDSVAPARRLNVLLITIDTLRADRIGRGLTPNLDALAARATRYTHARTTVPLTLPAHAAIMTGTLPSQDGVRVEGDVLAVRPTLARSFHDAGYRTAAFVGTYLLDRRFGLSGGFDTYDDRVPRRASGAPFEAERRGNLVADAALTWLSGTGGSAGATPFFAWVHLYDPHAPYDPPQEYLARAEGNAYDGEVAFADAQVGRVLEWLRTSGQEAWTIVAVAGDHGEGLGDHGELEHGMLAYDSTLRVPLLLAVPSAGAGRDVDTSVSLADLAGTLLQAAGVSVPDGMRKGLAGSDGEAYAESLYPRSAGWHAVSALAFDRWKLIASSETELYDIAADPGETHNVAGEKLSAVEAGRRRLTELAAVMPVESTRRVSPEAAERLHALGYSSGTAAPIDDAAQNPARTIASWNTYRHALARLSAGDARGALPDLTKLARVYPDAPVFQATYARALKDTGRAAQAVDLYRRLVSRWPGDAQLYHELAVAAEAAGMTVEAVRAEQASLALQPVNATASNGLGLLLTRQGATADAVRAFERATEDDPSNAVFWTNLGNARRDGGDAARAEQAYTHALELDPQSADAANGMGLLLLQERQAGRAVPWFERALAGSPRFVQARLNLGTACQESGNRDKAIEAYRRVLGDAPPGSREYETATERLAQLSR